jgi:hypothetical protein|tara:strand:+ start:371 stop:1162 length:792 start_codon:yes stop_codon:yes gene_type:complete
MFDDNLLIEFMNTFLGYGNSNDKFCFVGLEEGMSVDPNLLKTQPKFGFNEVNAKLKHWEKRGKLQLEDCREFHLAFGETKWHQNPTQIQPTWEGPMSTILSFEGKDIASNLLNYQQNQFASKDGNSSMIELRPLPSKRYSGSKWFYKHYSQIEYLNSKSIYEKEITSMRVKLIKSFLENSKIQFVIFLSNSKINQLYWEQITDTKFKELGDDFKIAERDNRYYFMTYHPTNFYVSKDLLKSGSLQNVFVRLGKFISKLKEKHS